MGPERDDYGIIRPTPDAFLTTLMLLFKASEHDKNYQIPPGNVSTDSEGGIRIEWLGEQRNVHLVVPVNKPPYIYSGRLDIGFSACLEEATPELLLHWLRETFA